MFIEEKRYSLYLVTKFSISETKEGNKFRNEVMSLDLSLSQVSTLDCGTEGAKGNYN